MLQYQTEFHELRIVDNEVGTYTLTLRERGHHDHNHLTTVHLVLSKEEMSKVLGCFQSYIEHGR